MKPIFNKTLRNMFKPLILVIYFITTIFITIFIFLGSRAGNALTVNILTQIESIKIVYILFTFFWLLGIALIILIMIFGLDIFATEEYEGTMKILVAKPVSRSSIVIGKILGLITGSFIYFLSSLLLSITIFTLFMKLDKDVFIGLIKLLPSLMIYGAFIIILFSSITSLLSSIFRKKIPSIIILVFLILGTYGILPIVRNIFIQRNIYESSKFYYVDINAHFGNILMSLVENGKEENELYDNSIITFTGRYIMEYDPDLNINTNYSALKKNDYINVNIVSTIYMTVSSAFFLLSYNIMKKKDIT